MSVFKEVKCGDIFGKWIAIADRSKDTPLNVRCKCECGTIKDVLAVHLFSGKSTKCVKCNGKIQGERIRKVNRNTDAYKIYKGLVSRCNGNDKKHLQYKGMEYCSFEVFFDCVGERPSEQMSIDRIDNTKGYIQGNIRWTTMQIQQNNKHNTIYFVDKLGEKHCITDICKKYGLKYNTARSPKYRNLSLEDLIESVSLANKNGNGNRQQILHLK